MPTGTTPCSKHIGITMINDVVIYWNRFSPLENLNGHAAMHTVRRRAVCAVAIELFFLATTVLFLLTYGFSEHGFWLAMTTVFSIILVISHHASLQVCGEFASVQFARVMYRWKPRSRK